MRVRTIRPLDLSFVSTDPKWLPAGSLGTIVSRFEGMNLCDVQWDDKSFAKCLVPMEYLEQVGEQSFADIWDSNGDQ